MRALLLQCSMHRVLYRSSGEMTSGLFGAVLSTQLTINLLARKSVVEED